MRPGPGRTGPGGTTVPSGSYVMISLHDQVGAGCQEGSGPGGDQGGKWEHGR